MTSNPILHDFTSVTIKDTKTESSLQPFIILEMDSESSTTPLPDFTFLHKHNTVEKGSLKSEKVT